MRALRRSSRGGRTEDEDENQVRRRAPRAALQSGCRPRRTQPGRKPWKLMNLMTLRAGLQSLEVLVGSAAPPVFQDWPARSPERGGAPEAHLALAAMRRLPRAAAPWPAVPQAVRAVAPVWI